MPQGVLAAITPSRVEAFVAWNVDAPLKSNSLAIHLDACGGVRHFLRAHGGFRRSGQFPIGQERKKVRFAGKSISENCDLLSQEKAFYANGMKDICEQIGNVHIYFH